MSSQTLLERLGLEPFRPRPPWWGPDLQTLRDTLRPDVLPACASTPLALPLGPSRQGRDGSLLAWLDPPAADAPSGRPRALVLLLHGLGGSSQAEGVRRLGWCLNRAGFAVLRLNMRGAGDGRALASGTYAARCSSDLAPALGRARELAADRPLLAVGLSLGGTVLLNAVLDGVAQLEGLALVSSPLDLAHCSATISRPRNLLYERWLLERLRQQTLNDGLRPDAELVERLRRVDSIRGFDALITAPRWGYPSVDAYYRQASPLPRLLVPEPGQPPLPPTLIVQALDDPWVPAAGALALGPPLEVVISPGGGHNGFHAPGGCWSDQLVLRWLEQRLGSRVC
ncbi:alpha/beta fold hydrolase [Synechococcus sp. CBW1107]|uniref:YheT family hydrolase n=1 Tax=Synechococcus sp. CBW1107 TaxID=2789857 RepID=UPI0018CD22A4|nr:alpha/beta fold hydrolase [Synechococcus sp. CBW1107]QPN56057.1 alpha/beta fold hydrolase [Synechococcus sp. CBW1107]